MRKIVKSIFGWLYRPVFKKVKYWKRKNQVRNFLHELKILDNTRQRVFYLGITNHSNLGDMAQHYCINRWINMFYKGAALLKLEAETVVDEKLNVLSYVKEYYRENDVIIFQSGYTTQDLGGCHELMHRLVINSLPNAKILMMPQTIFFQNQDNKLRTSYIYNKAKNMLFLARDKVSYNMALEMFPNIKVLLFPDIVTTLIGTLHFSNLRSGICLCVRNDTEKFYTDTEINSLKVRLEKTTSVSLTDTSIKKSYRKIRKKLKYYIEKEIESFSKFDVTVTDRYHGTIFSLAAGTPVIVLQTNDHKVITGADWFRNVYDDYVYIANNLEEVISIYSHIMNKKLDHKLKPYFASNYYDKLKSEFEKNEKSNEGIMDN